MMVSTTPIAIHAISAAASGAARRSMGRSSARALTLWPLRFDLAHALLHAASTPVWTAGVGTIAGAARTSACATGSGQSLGRPLGLWMRCVVHAHQVYERDLRIFLGGREAGVAQQFLNGAEVGS